MEIDKSRAITIEEWQQAKEMEKVQMIDFAYECRNVMAADDSPFLVDLLPML
jgi:hypothetical protein